MTASDLFIITLPALALVLAMLIAFGIVHWNDNRNRR